MSTINIGTRDGVINNLTVLGTLTAAAITSPGFKGKTVSLFNGSSAQSIANSGNGSNVTFPAPTANTMGSELSLSLSNSRLTYMGTDSRSWLVSFTVGTTNANTVIGAVFNAFIMKNGVATIRYGQVYTTTYGCASCVVSGSVGIPMSPGDYIELVCYQISSPAVSITISSSTYFPSTLAVLE